MADNTVLDAGSGGDTIASDDIGGVKFPRGKIVIGADGTNDGDVSAANPLPVKGTGTAGTANSGVLTVQGISSMTPLQVADNGSTLSIDDGGASITVDGTVAVTGTFWQATQPVSGTVAATQSGSWTVTGAGGTFPVTDSGGSLTIDAPVGTPAFVRLSDGSAAITTLPVSLASVPSHAVTNAGTFAVQASQAGTWAVGLPASASGGATPLKLISAGSTNATSVKGSAGTLYALVVTNTNAAVRYLKLYNLASAPTVGTSTPVLTLAVPGNTAGAGVVFPIPACGIEFSTGIALATTTGAADNDTGAVAANEIIVAGAYE
jgi:hypothetical protein